MAGVRARVRVGGLGFGLGPGLEAVAHRGSARSTCWCSCTLEEHVLVLFTCRGGDAVEGLREHRQQVDLVRARARVRLGLGLGLGLGAG